MIDIATALFDVVLDVPTSHLDEPFTYAASDKVPGIGARVHVPFGNRTVAGWVVRRSAATEAASIKPIAEICDDRPLSEAALALATWLRRRYACTFREAIAAVTPRVAAPSSLFTFVKDPAPHDRLAQLLRARYMLRPFSAIAAERALHAAGMREPLASVQRKLTRLASDGVLERRERARRSSKPVSTGKSIIELAGASAAKGRAQARLAATLEQHGGFLEVAHAQKLASVSAAVVRSSCKAGVVRMVCSAAPNDGAVRAAPLVPTDEQRSAIEKIDTAMQIGPATALLQGVTGSGKTFVYSRLIDRVRSRGGRAIVLVPEIALTPQTAGRFVAVFGSSVRVLHSGLSEAQRAGVWRDAADGVCDVVVGARSAVFAPLPNLQLVIIDEEHEPSYKQDIAPRYDAAAVAMQRMKTVGGAVVLGSATPSLESFWAALQGELLHVRLSQRATNAPLPSVDVVDMRKRTGLQGKRVIGAALADSLESRLHAREKSLLFVNRRGYAGLLLCRACGFAPRCRRCAVSLVVHAADRSMRCHVCGDAFRVPASCPKCGSADLHPYGCGTQRVEAEVRELFPDARVVRMDSDTTGAQGSHERLLDSFARNADILIGTQMIAKGLDYPTVTLVGVVAADLDLNRPDFRAAERTFALLTQVAGRAGRAAPGSRVIVQAYATDHYAISLAAQHDYESFARKELEIRRELRYPPFGRIAHIIVASVSQTSAEAQAREFAMALAAASNIEVLGPAPDTLSKARGEYRMRIALKSVDEPPLLDACAAVRARKLPAGVRTAVIVDPR